MRQRSAPISRTPRIHPGVSCVCPRRESKGVGARLCPVFRPPRRRDGPRPCVHAARDRASDLFEGLGTLDAIGEADHVEMKGETLKWLVEKFRADANEIMKDLDHAQQATGGRVYGDAAAR